MAPRYTMDAHDFYDGDSPLRDTDLCARLNEQDDDLDRARERIAARTAEQEAALSETESYRAANAALESQIGQAHEALLLAQADAETLRHKIAIALPTISAFKDSYLDAVAEHLEVQLRTAHPGTPLADEVRAARAANAQGRRLADAVQAYFNTLGTNKIDRRPERYEIYGMAEALADYGIIEQQQAALNGIAAAEAALLAAVAGADDKPKS